MSFLRHRRVASVTASALLALMLIGPAAVHAGTPGWKFYITPIPANGVVGPGASAGFTVTIANEGKSNISALFLGTDLTATAPNGGSPTYVGPISWANPTTGAGFCHDAGDGPLYCDLGSLVAGQSVTVTVAFQMPLSGSSSFSFLAFGNGNTPSDGGTSHGDALKGLISINGGNSKPPVTPAARIALNASKNFAGGFSTNTAAVANDSTLGPKNIQAGAVVPPQANLPITIEDGLADSTFDCSSLGTVCTNRFGEWVRLNVGAGSPFSAGIHVTYTILGNKVPSAATTETIVLIHSPGPGETWSAETISNRCDNPDGGLDPDANDDGVGEECILVTEVGKNFQVDAWLLKNGGTRFGY